MLRRGSFGASHGRYCPVRLVTVVVTVPARFWSRLASSLNGIPSPPKRAGTLIYRGILDTLSLSVFLGPNRLGGLAKARVAGSNPVSRSNTSITSTQFAPPSFLWSRFWSRFQAESALRRPARGGSERGGHTGSAWLQTSTPQGP